MKTKIEAVEIENNYLIYINERFYLSDTNLIVIFGIKEPIKLLKKYKGTTKKVEIMKGFFQKSIAFSSKQNAEIFISDFLIPAHVMKTLIKS